MHFAAVLGLLISALGCSSQHAVPRSLSDESQKSSVDRENAQGAGSQLFSKVPLQLSRLHGNGPLTITEGGDTSDDECPNNSFCGLQAQGTTIGPIGEQNGDCVTWSVTNVPSNASAIMSPVSTCNPNSSNVVITPSVKYSPGPVTVTVVATDQTNGGTTQVNITMNVLCSENSNTCPQLEVENVNNGNAVISSPAPQQSAIVGQQMNMKVLQQPNANIGTYAVTNLNWQVPNSPLKSYDLTATSAVPVPLPTSTGSTVVYYWNWPGSWSFPTPQQVTVTGKLTKGSEIADGTATVNYQVTEPNVTSLNYGGTNTTRVGPYESGASNEFLSFGGLETPYPQDAGIMWDWSAVAPAGGDGYIAITQLVASTESDVLYSPLPTPSPSPLITLQSTNNFVEKDTCTIYTGAVAAKAGVSAEISFTTSPKFPPADSPGDPTRPPYQKSLTAADAFTTILIFRPSGTNSIWVPIGEQKWNWGGTANYTGTGFAYTLQSGLVSNAPPGYDAADLPTFSGVFAPTPMTCPTLPPKT